MATPKEILEGKPFRSPLHPALVHLPIALFPLSFLLDVASWIFTDPELHLVRSAFIAIAAGIATAVVASAVGIVDYTSIRDDHPAKKKATLHMMLNLLSVGLYALGLGLRYGSLDDDRTALVPLVVSFVALGILGYSGYLGGDIVYSDGVAVGRHRRRTRLPEKTQEVPRVSGSTAPVPLAHAETLTEGETLRVDAGGTIVAVAKSRGRVCAFQEFCTHRYGPLSEGEIENGQVVCPWHGSRFDVASGRVTEGPAKVDLRTFPVEERGGKLSLQITEDRPRT